MILINDILTLSLMCEKLETYIVEHGRDKVLDEKSKILDSNFIKQYRPFIANKNLRKLCIEMKDNSMQYIKLTNFEKICQKSFLAKFIHPSKKILKQKNDIKKVFVENVTKYNVLLKLSTPSNTFEISTHEPVEGFYFMEF